MKRFVVTASALTFAMLLAGGAGAAPHAVGSFKGHELAGQARLSLSRARSVALKARPGAITDQQLEKESGGSGLRYSFDINSAGQTYEVGVDANTGKVLENGRENGAAEAAEH